MTFSKEKALFWLNRRVRELEEAAGATDKHGHEVMAEAKLPYSVRQEVIAVREAAAEKNQAEVATLRDVISFIEERA